LSIAEATGERLLLDRLHATGAQLLPPGHSPLLLCQAASLLARQTLGLLLAMAVTRKSPGLLTSIAI
jgi:hypothetical protein